MSLNAFTSLLKVDVQAAKDLKDTDAIGGKSDPYAKITFEEKVAVPHEGKTHVINNSANPVWNSTFFFLVADECKSFKLELFDKDLIGRDDKLGNCHILRRDPEDRSRPHTEWYYLEKGKGGTVQVTIQEASLSSGIDGFLAVKKQILDEAKKEAAHPVDFLEIHLDHCKDLVKADFFGSSDPYIKFNFTKDKAGEHVVPHAAHTKTIMNNLNPVFNERFYFLIPTDMKIIRFDIYDYDKASGDDIIGHTTVIMDAARGQKTRKECAVEKKGKLVMSYTRVDPRVLF